MERILIYQTLFKELSTGEICIYIGSHRTSDPNWPEPGCRDKYIGSCRIVVQENGRYNRKLKPGWVWVSTSILEECDGSESTLAIEGKWILDAMYVFGIHPEAKKIIRRKGENHPLLKIHDGVCLNCHRNSELFANTDYYREWLKSQGIRAALANSPEARAKAKATRDSHREELRKIASVAAYNYCLTEAGKEKSRRFNIKANSKECRDKARITRHNNMDQWLCVGYENLGQMPLRKLGEELGLGRGAQQCWSRLGKPDIFSFKTYIFKLVRHGKSSNVE